MNAPRCRYDRMVRESGQLDSNNGALTRFRYGPILEPPQHEVTMMTKHWLTAALLSSAIVAGCSGGGTDNNAQNQPAAAPPAAAPAPAPEPAPQAAPPVAPAPAPAPAPRPAPARPQASRPAAAPSTASSEPAPRPAPAAAAPAPAEPPRPAFREVSVPSGTPMVLELVTPVSSETAQVEDQVRARVKQAVMADGATVIPAGAILHGNVTAVERADA